MKRKVEILLIGTNYFVSYIERKKHKHKCAAQFDASFKSREYVVQWVNDNPKLELVNEKDM